MNLNQMPTYREMLQSWLKENGYDGLFNHGECACEPGDIAPCDLCDTEIEESCHPGYRVEGCDGGCCNPGYCDYHIQGTKPADKPEGG